jgi:hypothetical protein
MRILVALEPAAFRRGIDGRTHLCKQQLQQDPFSGYVFVFRKWHTLIDKVLSELNLFCSAGNVRGKKGAAGVDRQTVEDFAEHEREEVNRTTQGWFNDFRHCFWSIFKDYDGLIRRRPRRLLLKRNRRNSKRPTRMQRWPNASLTEHGFVSLNERPIRFVQSTGTN